METPKTGTCLRYPVHIDMHACACICFFVRCLAATTRRLQTDASSSPWCASGARLLDPQPTASGHHGPVLIKVEPTLVSHQGQHACCSTSEKARADSLVEDSAPRGPAPDQTHFVLCPGLHCRRSGQDSMGMPPPRCILESVCEHALPAMMHDSFCTRDSPRRRHVWRPRGPFIVLSFTPTAHLVLYHWSCP